jgi:hypothetical protein
VTVYVLPAVKVSEEGNAKLAVEAPSSKRLNVMVGPAGWDVMVGDGDGGGDVMVGDGDGDGDVMVGDGDGGGDVAAAAVGGGREPLGEQPGSSA